MALNKHKIKYIWCSNKKKYLKNLTPIKKGNRFWKLTKSFQLIRFPSYIRCATCNQKFKIRIDTCGDYDCYHAYIPPHKKKQKYISETLKTAKIKSNYHKKIR